MALDATLRAAAARKAVEDSTALRIRPDDLRERVRTRRSAFSVVFVVDNSYSIHADRTVEKAKGLEARALRRRSIVTIVADTSDQTAKLGGCGVELAEAAGGQWLPFDEFVYRSIEAAWRERDLQ